MHNAPGKLACHCRECCTARQLACNALREQGKAPGLKPRPADPIQWDEFCKHYTGEHNCYRDPEGLQGYGKTRGDAVYDLLVKEYEAGVLCRLN